MDKIILKDQTSFEIADGASLGNIQIKAENFDAVKTITDAFSADNLQKVTFTHNDAVSGKYTDLKSDGFTYMPNVGEDGAEDGTYTVTVRLRTKTEMEKAIDKLKAGHEANAEAIEELASIATESEV
nr:MAG TPA: iron transport protein [Caudoviricetes sp.]